MNINKNILKYTVKIRNKLKRWKRWSYFIQMNIFLELLEENLYSFNKEGYDDLTVNMELDSSVDKLD